MQVMQGGKPVVIDDRMARDMAGKILQQAKKTGANNPGPGVPKAVPVTEQEEQQYRGGSRASPSGNAQPGNQKTIDKTLDILNNVGGYLSKPQGEKGSGLTPLGRKHSEMV